MNREKPNILWLMTDEQRTDSLGCYGSSWAQTPNLDRIAGEGVLFRNAITPAPVCLPARASFLTGRYPSSTGLWWNVIDGHNELDHLTYIFQEAGYRTASFGKGHYGSSNPAFQTEGNLTYGDAVRPFAYTDGYDPAEFDVIQYPPEPYPWIFGGVYPEPGEKKAEAISIRNAISWLEEHPADTPFFLRLSFNGPHTPVVPPEPFDTMINSDDVKFATEGVLDGRPKWIADSLGAIADSSRLSADQIRRMRAYYYGEVAFLDAQCGILLDWMRERGLLENTIIAYVSDHGTHMGDYGLVQKQTFYEPVVTVPFFFHYPAALAKGIEINTPVEARSLLPTFLQLAGLPIPDHCEGDSLAGTLIEGKEPQAKPVFSEFTLGSFEIRHDDRLVMVREGDWKLSLCMDPEPFDGALYNLAEDPYEVESLYGRPGYKDVEDRLTGLIEEHLSS